MDSPPIFEPLLEEIFLRLPTLADLARASCAFSTFRRLVTEQSFLRLYHKLHVPPPALAGFVLRNRNFLPVDPSYSTASASKAIAGTADFSFKFLPVDPSCYAVSDIRDGRVLLNIQPFDYRSLAVCDPLHRRYVLLPPIPSSFDWVEPTYKAKRAGSGPSIKVQTFLAPGEEAGEDTSFRVFWMAGRPRKHKQLAFVFSSSTGQWETIPLTVRLALYSQRQYACRCFYWVTDLGENLLVLDTHTVEFSLAELPPQVRDFDHVDVDIAIVEAGEGSLGAFFLESGASDLSYIVRRNSEESSNQWELKKTISLGSSRYSFGNCTAMHLFLHDGGSGSNDAALFSLDIKTFKLERVFASQYGKLHAYSNFPPIFSTPTISSEMYSVESTGASGNAGGSGQLVWTNSMSTMMLNYLVVLVAVGPRTSDEFTRVHHNYCAKALSDHFKLAITGKQVCNHLKKWREIWGKVEKVKYSSGALWDAGTCNIRRSEKHYAGHSKDRKDVPFLNTSVEQRRAMERIFGTTTTREYAKSGSETLSVKVREIEEDTAGDGNGEVNLSLNVGEPSNSKPPQKKKAKVVNTENDA